MRFTTASSGHASSTAELDAITLDRLIGELRPRLLGGHLRRPRARSAHAIVFDVPGDPGRLWLDAERGSVGLYGLTKAQLGVVEALSPGDRPGRTRQAVLLLRKHIDGRRITDLRRIPGERMVVLAGTGFELVLRFAPPALTVVIDGDAVATIGSGPVAWPLPAAAPEREWTELDGETLDRILADAAGRERSPVGALLGRFPGFGPWLGRELIRRPGSLPVLRARLHEPRPTLFSAVALAEACDADLAPPHGPAIAPLDFGGHDRVASPAKDWVSAAASLIVAVARGRAFDRARKRALESAAQQRQRLERLELNLSKDQADWPDEGALRRRAEALLASPRAVVDADGRVRVPDPYTDRSVTIELDPRLDLPANAEKLYSRARRIERGRTQVAGRLAGVRAELDVVRERELRARDARDIASVPEPLKGRREREKETEAQARHYLTSRGLSIWIGRGARENHELTFARARPEDLWLHARDVPGAHVVLRDNEGRANDADRREAAEVAAFFSAARETARADVHVTRRKHVRPVKGALGRVLISYSETLRVTPRDPEGRLRRR